jgi:hypothetical protein
MGRLLLVAATFCLAWVLVCPAAAEEMRLNEVVSRLCSEIPLGLPRRDVERVLDTLPLMNRNYQEKDVLDRIGQGSFQGQPLSGKYVVETHAEFSIWEFFVKKQAFFDILLDQQERVLNVHVRTFGIPTPQCPSPK